MNDKKWVILSVLVAVVLIFVFAMLFTNSAKTETRQAQIDKQFSVWDKSHHESTKRIKASMHDPLSYQHVKTTYVDSEEYLIVTTTFRGKKVQILCGISPEKSEIQSVCIRYCRRKP